MPQSPNRRPILPALLGLATLLALPAHAAAPALLPVHGFLTDADGAPVDGEIAFAFTLYGGPDAADLLYTEDQLVDLDEGSFAAQLGAGETGGEPLDLALFHAEGEVWVGVALDGGDELPLFQLGTVPFAAHADFADLATDADALGGLDAEDYALSEDVQALITGACGADEALQSVNADGTVTCTPLSAGDITGVTPGVGLSGGGSSGDVTLDVDTATIQARVSGTCAAGEAIQSIAADGSVTCEADDDTTYAAGSGLTLTGDTFSVDTASMQARISSSCAAGTSIRAIAADGSVTCETDDDTDTTYTAGTGLGLSSGAFSVDTTVIQNRVSGSCVAGESIRHIGSAGGVTCEADDDTTYTAGTGLALTGTEFSTDTSVLQARVSASCAAGESIRAIAADGSVTCETDDAGTTYSAGTGLTLSGSTFSVQNDSVGTNKLTWGVPLQLPMFPNAQTSSCGGSSVGGANFGSTTSASNVYIGNQFYNEDSSGRGLEHNYRRARLQVTCRGSGEIELMNSCSGAATSIASITCSGGTRPWTATSDEFDPGSSASWNLRVRATSGTLEWANPSVILY